MVSAPSKPHKKYFSIAETSFKDGFRIYTKKFRHKKYVYSTTLSKYMSKLKDEKFWYMTNITDQKLHTIVTIKL